MEYTMTNLIATMFDNNEKLRKEIKELKVEVECKQMRITELEAKVKEKEDTIYILNTDSLDKTEKIRTLNQNLSNLKGQISHNYDLGYEAGKTESKTEHYTKGYADGHKDGSAKSVELIASEVQHEAHLKGYEEGTAAVFEIWDRVRAK